MSNREVQTHGPLGKMVDGMIRRSVRARFHTVYWNPPSQPLPHPCIVAANHHGWFDGYLAYHAMTRLGVPFVDWIQEFGAFPLFAKVGGMPFPPNDAGKRAETVRRTIRAMRAGAKSLLLFPEGVLHYPHELLPFGRALEVVARHAGCATVPLALCYEHALHERPECFLAFGDPIPPGDGLTDHARKCLAALIGETRARIREDRQSFEVLAPGTLDVNERWDVRKFRRGAS